MSDVSRRSTPRSASIRGDSIMNPAIQGRVDGRATSHSGSFGRKRSNRSKACFSDFSKLLKRWSGRRGSNPRRPAWEQVGWMCLQQLSVSGALYRLIASLAKSAFPSLTPSNRGFIKVHFTVIRTSFCAAFHGGFSNRLAFTASLEAMGVQVVIAPSFHRSPRPRFHADICRPDNQRLVQRVHCFEAEARPGESY